MYDRFKKYISILLDEMVEGVRLEYISKSKRYRKLQRKKRRLQHQILNNLPEDKQHLLFEYEESVNAQNAYMEDYIYRKGIFHGIRLSSISIRLFKR
ncbi:MAG: hypothetical protein BWY74_02305 [Firmicutes bacterium ADurb.Bin419]|nr:MAG: hypothetical protein BWY74_02305 [Firmicutes bacterium ADurb.Bin419]